MDLFLIITNNAILSSTSDKIADILRPIRNKIEILFFKSF